MTETSRLEAAAAEAATEGPWYRSPVALVAGLILFLGVLALIVLSFTSGDDGFGGEGVLEVNAVTITGDSLPAIAGGGAADPAVGTKAPVVTATSLANGSEVTLGEGRARVIGFFAHWCPHCQAELPELTAWLAANDLPPNTEFIAVSTAVDEGRGNYPPSAWFTAEEFTSPVLVDDAEGSLLGAFGFSGFPAFVAIDSSGTVVARAGGNIGVAGFEDLLSNFAS